MVRMTAREREARAIQMRQQGLTYEEIGDTLGITKSGAFRTIERWFDRHEAMVSEQAERVRATEGQRLDAMQAKLWPFAMGGQTIQVQVTRLVDGNVVSVTEDRTTPPDPEAIETILKIMTRRAKLFNLDLSPKVVAPSDPAPQRPLIGSAQNVLVASSEEAASLREALTQSQNTRQPNAKELRTRDLSEEDTATQL